MKESKKIFNVVITIFVITLLTGCFNDKKEPNTNSNENSTINSNSNSNIENSNVVNSNIISNSNVASNIVSNSNITSNIVSNVTSNNVVSNTNPVSNTVADTKKLNCSTTINSENGIKLSQTNDITFSNNTVKSLIMYMDVELPSNYASAANTYFSTLKNQYQSQYGKYNGVTVTATQLSTLKSRFTISIDFSKLSSTDKAAIGFVGSEDYNVNKAAFERQGYVCR